METVFTNLGRRIRPCLNFLIQLSSKWAFIVISILLLVLNLSQENFTFHHDSNGYWSLRNTFENNGAFSFLNYDKLYPGFRAYLFPFLNYCISKLALLIKIPDYLLYEVVMSVFYGAFLTLIVPTLVQKLFKREPGFMQTLVFSLLAIYFWRGMFFYPNSDILSFIFLVVGTYFALISKKRWIAAVFAGLFWGGATLIRPIYQIALFPAIGWLVFFYTKEIKLSFRVILIKISMVGLGLIIVFAPQIAINVDHYGIFSPFVQTQIFLKGVDAFTNQLISGIWYQKYEGNIGANYPSVSAFFFDPLGEKILINSGFTSAHGIAQWDLVYKITRAEYFALLWKYPLSFIIIYARHLFNGLDIYHNTTYVNDIFDAAISFRMLNYTLWFLAIIYAAHKFRFCNRTHYPSIFMAIIFASPAILAIPIGIEVRYVLPLHFIAYALAAFWILPDFIEKDLAQKKSAILENIRGYVIFTLLCFIISSNTFANLEYRSSMPSRPDTQKPKTIQCGKEIYNESGPVILPGSGSVSTVDSIPLSIKEDNYYSIEFDVEALDNDTQLFYTDFYGGPDYDRAEQDRNFTLKKGNHTYNAVLYTGGDTLPPDVNFRMVSITNTPLTITNIKVTSCKHVAPIGLWKYRVVIQDWFRTNFQLNRSLLMPILIPSSVPVTDE